jgi:hypothetical protein
VFVAGTLRSASATFGRHVVTRSPRLDGGDGSDAFLVKLTPQGDTAWVLATRASTGTAAAVALVYSPFHQVCVLHDVESGPGGRTREVETPLASNSPHGHMRLRVDLVGSHGRWKRMTV